MDYFDKVLTAISTVGFPIVMCCGLLYYCYKQNQVHKEESKQFSDAISQLTVAIQQLTDYLRKQRYTRYVNECITEWS